MNNVSSLTPSEPRESVFDAENVLRAPPHNYEVERALLGTIFKSNRAFERVSEFLEPHHFADGVNGRIYQACAKLIEQGRQADPVTLKHVLERDDLVIAAGGIKYLVAIEASAITGLNAADYGQTIYDLFLRRELIALGERMVRDAYESDPDETAMDQMERSEQGLYDLASGSGSDGGLIDIQDAAAGAIELAQAAHRNGGKLVGLTTGLNDLNAKTGGLFNTDLLILAGRPSMGKTALATTMAYNAARYFKNPAKEEDRGKFVAFFSLEMAKEQLANRILAHLAKVDSHRIRTGLLSNEEMERLCAAGDMLAGVPLKIDDKPAQTVSAIRTRARRLARQASRTGKGGLGLIVIDYLQLISPGGKERPENRVQEISAITRGLKALAKELEVPVLALSQLSRAVEQRDDKRPQLSDLRESGTIEQDADAVMFVFREQYYLERAEPQQKPDEAHERFSERYTNWQARCAAANGIVETLIAKQRHGPIGTVKLHFEQSTTWVTDLQHAAPTSPPERPKSRPAPIYSHSSKLPDGRPVPPAQEI